MKKLSLIVASVVLAGVAANANPPVYSQNGVGYVEISVPAGPSIISIPFNKVGGDALSIDDVFGTNAPDQSYLYFYVPGSGYTAYQYFDPDGWYGDSGLAGTNKIVRGEGFWFIPPAPASITVVGEIPGQADSTNAIPIVNGVQLVSFAYPASGDLSTFTPDDQDYLYDYVPGSGYKAFQYFDPDGWYGDAGATNISFQIGKGYWYISQAAGAKQWQQTKPYVWP